jgi:hypothetical protein
LSTFIIASSLPKTSFVLLSRIIVYNVNNNKRKGVWKMTMLENFREKVVGATRSAVKASSEFIEVTKINLTIKSEEDKVKEIMFEIGKIIYENYKEGKAVEGDLSVKCDNIVESEEKILELKKKIMDIKNLKNCEGCGSEIDTESSYCHKCGKKV